MARGVRVLRRLAVGMSVILVTSLFVLGLSQTVSGGGTGAAHTSAALAVPAPGQPLAPVVISRSGGVISASSVLPLVASSTMGGNDDDMITSVCIDDEGAVYAVGYTWGGGFPVTSGAYREFSSGQYDAFVRKWHPNGTLAYSTFLGGQLRDYAYAVDAYEGRAYVVGVTESSNYSGNFFTTPDAFAGEINLGLLGNLNFDGFLVIFDTAGSSLVYSTYFGSSGNDFIYDIEI